MADHLTPLDAAFLELEDGVHALLARLSFAPRLFNVTITNGGGAQTPLYAFGARMRAIPLVPIFELTFGLNAGRATMPDLDELERGIDEALSEHA